MKEITARAYWTIEMFDKQNKKSLEIVKESDSFVDNFAMAVSSILKMPFTNIKDWNGNLILNDSHPHLCVEDPRVLGPVNINTRGIVLGSSDTPWTNTQYKLENEITNGTGAGQLLYSAEIAVSNYFNPATNKWIISKYRTFTNSSGENVTIKELGLNLTVGGGVVTGGYDWRRVLVMRDVISAIVLPTDNLLKVAITIEISA